MGEIVMKLEAGDEYQWEGQEAMVTARKLLEGTERSSRTPSPVPGVLGRVLVVVRNRMDRRCQQDLGRTPLGPGMVRRESKDGSLVSWMQAGKVYAIDVLAYTAVNRPQRGREFGEEGAAR